MREFAKNFLKNRARMLEENLQRGIIDGLREEIPISARIELSNAGTGWFMKEFHHKFWIYHRTGHGIQNTGLALLFTAGVLWAFCGIAFSAEDKIAADSQFSGNLALTTGGEYDIAEKGWEDFLKKYPNNSQRPHAEHYLGVCKYHTQHFEEAEAIFENELKEGKYPYQDESRHLLGLTYLQHALMFPIKPTGSRQGAINTVADRNYSISNEATELYRRAIIQFQTIRNQFPDSKYRTQAIYNEALSFIQLGSYENALGDLKLVIAEQNFPDLNQALYTLAEVYINLKNQEEKKAMITLNTLLENKPEAELRLRAKRLLADVYFMMGDYKEAEKQLKGILNGKAYQKWLDPKTEVTSVLNLAFYYYRFGETCVKLRQYDRAADLFGRITSDFPNSSVYPHALYQQGLAMKNFNAQLKPGEENKAFDEKECLNLWRKILEIPGVQSDRILLRTTTHQLALLLLQMGEAEQALAAIEQIPPKIRTHSLLRDYADALEACGRRDEAIATYRTIFEKNQSPKNLLFGADAMLQIIQIYHKDKNSAGIIEVSGQMIVWDGFGQLPEVMRISFLEENAQALYDTGDFQAACDGWEHLLKQYEKSGDPDSWRVSIVYCLQKSGKSKDGYLFAKENGSKMKDEAKLIELRHIGGICSRDYAQTKKTKKLQKKYFVKAQNLLIKARKATKEVQYAHVGNLYYDLAMVYFLQKNYDNCQKYAQWGLRVCPDSPIADQLFFLNGRCEIEKGELEKAAETFEAFLEKFPQSSSAPEAGLLASQCFLKLDQTEKAVKIAKEMAEKFPNSNFQERGANVQAIAAMENKDYDAAMEAWNIILNSDSEEFEPLHAEASYEIGFCLYEKQEFEKAEKAFRDILKNYPDWDSNERTYNQLVKVLLEQKKLQEAQDTLAEMSGKFPESVFIRPLTYQLATFWYLAGKMEETEVAFRPILKNPPEKSDFIFRSAEQKTAWSFYNRKMFKETLDFVEGIDLNEEIPEGTSDEEKNEILSTRAELRFLKGMALFQLKDRSQALKEFQTILNDPALGQSFRENTLEMMVQIYEEEEKWESVLETSGQFIEVYPTAEGKTRMEFKRAMAFFRLQKFDEALALCESLAAANDTIFTPQSIFLKGEILFAQKQYESAIQAFYQVIYGVEDPKLQADAMFEAAQCFEMLGKIDKALKHYHDLLEKFPGSDKEKQAKRKMKKLSS